MFCRRWLLMAISVPLLWMPVGAQDKTVAEAVRMELGDSLSLQTTLGSVRLTAWGRPLVEIHAQIEQPKGMDADVARFLVDATTIDIDGDDSRAIRIKTNHEGLPRRHSFRTALSAVQYEILAPSGRESTSSG